MTIVATGDVTIAAPLTNFNSLATPDGWTNIVSLTGNVSSLNNARVETKFLLVEASQGSIGGISHDAGEIILTPFLTAGEAVVISARENVILDNRGKMNLFPGVLSNRAAGGLLHASISSGGGDNTLFVNNLEAREMTFVTNEGTNGSVVVAGAIKADSSISIHVDGSGNITGNSPVTAQELHLTSGYGNIGDGLNINVRFLEFKTGSGLGLNGLQGGQASIFSPDPFSAPTIGNSQADGGFTFRGESGVRVADITSSKTIDISAVNSVQIESGATLKSGNLLLLSTGDIKLSSSRGAIIVGDGAKLDASYGNVVLAAQSQVLLGNGSAIGAFGLFTAGQGNVSISAGNGSGNLVQATSTPALSISGNVLWNPTNQVRTTNGGNTATAFQRTIILDDGGAGIILGGNVKISASGVLSLHGASGFAPGASSPNNHGQSSNPPPAGSADPPGWFNNPGLTGATPPGQQLNQIGNPGQQKKQQTTQSHSNLVPVGWHQSAASINFADCRNFEILGEGDIDAMLDGQGGIRVNQGKCIIEAKSDTIVMCPSIQINCRRGAILELSVDEGRVIVRNLHDARKESVVYVLLDKNISGNIMPGQQLSLTERADSLGDDVTVRRSRERRIGHVVMRDSEFSYSSAFSENNMLKYVLSSADRNLANRILKTAAAMSIATAKHGPYHPESQP